MVDAGEAVAGVRKFIVAIGLALLGLGFLVEFTAITGLIGWQGLVALLALSGVWSGVEALQSRWHGRPDQGTPYQQ